MPWNAMEVLCEDCHAFAVPLRSQEIEEELPKVGGGSALMEVRAHLGKPEGPLPEFKAALIKALHLEEVRRFGLLRIASDGFG